MEPSRAVHLPTDVLQAFGLGKLDDLSAEVVMNHLNGCADCCKVVASQSGDDFLKRLRQVHGRNSTPSPAQTLAPSVASIAQLPGRPTTLHNLPPELAEHPQYEILRELGKGGMGVVYLAKNKLMDRLEVLKVVNQALLDRPGSAERFLREIRSAAKLNHPNVVAAYSALQIGQLLAFAMEYVEGEDLAAVVKSRGPLPVVHACHYVQQAAIGLQHAFEKGMVHRDIKPQNLILAREGKKHIVKVLDFGLAKATREKSLEAAGLTGAGARSGDRHTRLQDAALTGAGQMLGTPDYIAPEQTLDAAQADIRADIYSLGCTLHYLLSGRPPFAGKNLVEILQAHHAMEARPLNLVRSDVPESLAAVVRKMMAKEPSQRYPTPAEVVQALSAAVKPMAKGTPPKSLPPVPVPAAEGRPEDEKSMLRAETIVPSAGAGQATMVGGEPASIVAWDALATSNSVPAAVRQARSGRNRRAPAAAKTWLIGGGIGVGVLLLALLGMWASGVFTVKMKTPDGAAFVVLEIDQPDAEVTVDGHKISVHVPGDNNPIEIKVEPGIPHKLRVRKDGFEVVSRDVELKSGRSAPIRVRLEPVKAVPPPMPKPTEPPSKPKDNGFVPLFNDKDLTGWVVGNPVATTWKNDNGLITGVNRGTRVGTGCTLYTQNTDYADFHFRCEVLAGQPKGSMLTFRTTPPYKEGTRRYYGVLNPGKNAKDIESGWGIGSLYEKVFLVGDKRIAPSVIKDHGIKPGEWYRLEIIARGHKIEILVNGRRSVEYVATVLPTTRGAFGFDCPMGARIAFRKVEVKELPAVRAEK